MPAAPFTKAQVRRAIEGAKDGGLVIKGVEITRDKIVILSEEPKETQHDPRKPKSWG